MVAVEEAGKVTPVQEVPCLPSPAQDSESGYSSYAGSYGGEQLDTLGKYLLQQKIY